jgi:hypothetical protein
MSRDDPFADELRLQFSMMDSPVPSARFVEQTVRRYRSWRLRRRLAVAMPGVALVVSLGVAFGLSGAGGAGTGGSSSSSAIELSGHHAIHLANYTFPLPKGYAVTTSATATCPVVLLMTSPTAPTMPNISTGSAVWSPPVIAQPYSASSSSSTAHMAAGAGSDGGCLAMELSVPFTPTQSTPNPYVVGSQEVDVAGDTGWLETTNYSQGSDSIQLTVALPQVNGQMRDLVVGSSGLSKNQLVTVVTQGLSTSS